MSPMRDTLSTTLDSARGRAELDARHESDFEPCEHDHVNRYQDWGDGTWWRKCLGCGRKWEDTGERCGDEGLRHDCDDQGCE